MEGKKDAIAMNNIAALTRAREQLINSLTVGVPGGLSIERADDLEAAFREAVKECAAGMMVKGGTGT